MTFVYTHARELIPAGFGGVLCDENVVGLLG